MPSRYIFGFIAILYGVMSGYSSGAASSDEPLAMVAGKGLRFYVGDMKTAPHPDPRDEFFRQVGLPTLLSLPYFSNVFLIQGAISRSGFNGYNCRLDRENKDIRQLLLNHPERVYSEQSSDGSEDLTCLWKLVCDKSTVLDNMGSFIQTVLALHPNQVDKFGWGKDRWDFVSVLSNLSPWIWPSVVETMKKIFTDNLSVIKDRGDRLYLDPGSSSHYGRYVTAVGRVLERDEDPMKLWHDSKPFWLEWLELDRSHITLGRCDCALPLFESLSCVPAGELPPLYENVKTIAGFFGVSNWFKPQSSGHYYGSIAHALVFQGHEEVQDRCGLILRDPEDRNVFTETAVNFLSLGTYKFEDKNLMKFVELLATIRPDLRLEVLKDFELRFNHEREGTSSQEWDLVRENRTLINLLGMAIHHSQIQHGIRTEQQKVRDRTARLQRMVEEMDLKG